MSTSAVVAKKIASVISNDYKRIQVSELMDYAQDAVLHLARFYELRIKGSVNDTFDERHRVKFDPLVQVKVERVDTFDYVIDTDNFISETGQPSAVFLLSGFVFCMRIVSGSEFEMIFMIRDHGSMIVTKAKYKVSSEYNRTV